MTTRRAITSLGGRLNGLVVRDGHCLIWVGPRDRRAGIRVSIGSVRASAARWSWYLSRGAWPRGRMFKRCHNLRCISPGCLVLRPMKAGETVTTREAEALVLGRVADALDTSPHAVMRALDSVVA
jgi:hypothetical protein